MKALSAVNKMLIDELLIANESRYDFHSTIKNQQSTFTAYRDSLLRPDHKQFLPVLDGLPVIGQLLHDFPGHIRLNLV